MLASYHSSVVKVLVSLASGILLAPSHLVKGYSQTKIADTFFAVSARQTAKLIRSVLLT